MSTLDDVAVDYIPVNSLDELRIVLLRLNQEAHAANSQTPAESYLRYQNGDAVALIKVDMKAHPMQIWFSNQQGGRAATPAFKQAIATFILKTPNGAENFTNTAEFSHIFHDINVSYRKRLLDFTQGLRPDMPAFDPVDAEKRLRQHVASRATVTALGFFSGSQTDEKRPEKPQPNPTLKRK